MKKIQTVLMITTMLPSITFALFCPTNYNIINEGMSVDQVIIACGKPDSMTESIKKNDNIPQQWSYLIPQTVNMGGTSQTAQGTLQTSVTFDDKGKAVNISVNGIGVGSTTICGGSTVQLGDDKDKVKSACGNPAFINKSSTETEPDTKVTELKYNSGNPAMILVFENGKFVESK